MPQPYVSFIITSRNDKYITKQEVLVLSALKDLIKKIEKYDLSAEIIFIEWNPPSNRKKYLDLLRNIKIPKCLDFTLVSVDKKYHNSLYFSELITLCGERAANIGIRLATGMFLINKSQDTFYSEFFYKMLSDKQLKRGKINLIERYIVDRKYIKKELHKRKHSLNDNFVRKKNSSIFPYSLRSMGESLILEKKYWVKFRGFRETKFAVTLGIDGELFYCAYSYGLDVNTLDKNKNYILKPFHEKIFQNSVKENSNKKENKKNIFFKIYNFINNDKVFRGKIMIGRRSLFFIRLFLIKINKYHYLLKSNSWGIIKSEIVDKKILKNKIKYFKFI